MKKEMDLINVLLVEDNPGDVNLTLRALKKAKIKINIYVARDGEEALEFVFKKGKHKDAVRPDFILLDLNLPKIDGFEVLTEIKNNEDTRSIPVCVLTTSGADEDILRAYKEYANCFITKPVNIQNFVEIMQKLNDFWFTIVKIPGSKE